MSKNPAPALRLATVAAALAAVLLTSLSAATAQDGLGPFRGHWQTADGRAKLAFGGAGDHREVTFTAHSSPACDGNGVTATGTGTVVDATTMTATFEPPRCHDGTTLGFGPHVTFTFHPDDGTLTDNFGGGQTTYVRASAATP